jgi:hypothetical protein
MTRILPFAANLQMRLRHNDTKDESTRSRDECIIILKEVFEEKPPVEEIIFEVISMLLVLPVYDRIYVQRALRPLAQKMDCTGYLTDMSRALQETDAWVDLNILTDKGRRSLPDMGLEITPEFKLP